MNIYGCFMLTYLLDIVEIMNYYFTDYVVFLCLNCFFLTMMINGLQDPSAVHSTNKDHPVDNHVDKIETVSPPGRVDIASSMEFVMIIPL